MLRICILDIKRALFLIVAFLAFCTSVCAKESLITSVVISQPEELNGAYQLSVSADKPVEYKQKVLSQNSMYFDLKNSLSTDNLDTIYDNVSGIDALIVQQLENGKVRIYVNGENTSDTRLVFKVKSNAVKNEQNQIVINRPMREYRPTNDINEGVLPEDINWDENSFNTEHLLSSVFGIFDKKSDMTLVICLLLLVACVVVSKKLFAKVKMQEEPLIGLSSAYREDVSKEATELQNVDIARNLHSFANVKSSKNAADYKKFVTNTRLGQEFSPKKTAPVLPKNSIQQNYALGAYRNSQKNPYATSTLRSKQASASMYQKKVQKPSADFVSKVNSIQNNPIKKQGASVENIKFLESVTKIYEQSGRKDLAQGLRAGINNRRNTI